MLEMERKRIAEDRRIILDWLNAVYPRSLAEETILEAASQMTEPLGPDMLNRDLAFLAGLGLTVRSREPHPFKVHVQETRWALTSDGILFIERGYDFDGWSRRTGRGNG